MQAQTNGNESNRHLFSTARSKVYDIDENISSFLETSIFSLLWTYYTWRKYTNDYHKRFHVCSVYVHEVSGNFIDT